jgi:hypothetical protein
MQGSSGLRHLTDGTPEQLIAQLSACAQSRSHSGRTIT